MELDGHSETTLSLHSYILQNKLLQNQTVMPLSLPELSGCLQCILEGVMQFPLFVLEGGYAIALFPPEETGTAI